MAYIKLKNGKTLIYEERTDSYIETDLGELLFDFLSLDFKEYDSLYEKVGYGGDGFEINDLKDLIKQYPKTAQDNENLLKNFLSRYSHDDSCEIREYVSWFLLENRDSFTTLYQHPFINLSDTFIEGVLYDFNNYYYDINLAELQKIMTKLIHFCFLDNTNDLTPLERYYYVCATGGLKYAIELHATTLFSPKNLFYELAREKNQNYLIHSNVEPINDLTRQKLKGNVSVSLVFECKTVRDFLFWEFNSLLSQNTKVKRCTYCNRLFVAKGNYNTDCCDRVLNGNKYSCKKMMAIKRRKEKMQSSVITHEYEKAYKRMYARQSNHKISAEDFRLWVETASNKRDLAIAEYDRNPSDDIIQQFKEYLGNK